jgi:hypothetical protein
MCGEFVLSAICILSRDDGSFSFIFTWDYIFYGKENKKIVRGKGAKGNRTRADA